MSNLIENHFRKISDNKYIVVNQQLWALVMGIIVFLLPVFFILSSVSDGFGWNFISITFAGILVVFLLCFSFFLIVMGLFKTTTEINLSTRKVSITKRNIRGAQATSEASIDDLCISAVRMGVSDSAPYGAWIVRAGFLFEGENGEDNSVSIWSKEVDKEQNIKERNDIMFELYRFFFPDCPSVTEENFITNGTVVMLLSDQEKKFFVKKANEPPRLKITKDELKRIQKKNWDKLI